MKSVLPCLGLCLAIFATLLAADKNPELQPFQGRWEVIELVENGHVIPQEAIREWLPSGGRIEIVDNVMMYTSTDDGKKHVKVFAIDATQFPKGFDMMTREKKEATGIYKFDDGKLVVCLSDPEEGPQPTEFSAKEGSKRMLMVLKRMPTASSDKPAPALATASNAVAAKVITDAEVTRMLAGTWRYRDDAGALIVTFLSDGTWSTVREVAEMRLFKKVFVQTPVSGGTWTVKNGVLNFHCTSSVHVQRVNHTLPFTIRSITEKDMIFVDYMGRLGKAAKIL